MKVSGWFGGMHEYWRFLRQVLYDLEAFDT
jgi:hypothetical protein